MENLYAKKQLNFFDVNGPGSELSQAQHVFSQELSNKNNIHTDENIEKFKNYNLETYKKDIEEIGLSKTWNFLNYYILNYAENINKFLKIENLAELYEFGLAFENKNNKKENGQYYTPDDVANVMVNWFKNLKGDNICDVACGTGKLILTFLDIIGKDKAEDIIKNGHLYLYDLDETALSICKTILLVKYGRGLTDCIHDIHCDFLSKKIILPENCKVISNPPYSNINSLNTNWDRTEVALNTKELYSMFMEKIIKQSKSSVIITPYSFIGGKKFYSLRKLMNNHSGFVVSFDNVPGNIFYGRKYGIFNTNTSNSVRAAITVVNNVREKGFKISPLIRFKNEERNILLKNEFLENFLPDNYQLVNKEQSSYVKCFKELFPLYEEWVNKSDSKLKNFISANATNYVIYVPNTCRYFTTGSARKLNRNGSITLNIVNKKYFGYIYCLINSSFAYWWWRIFDGGITYPVSLLNSLPVFVSLLTDEDFKFFDDLSKEMIDLEESCITTKLNAGKLQENIKFPSKFREEINAKFVKILKSNISSDLLNLIHNNRVLKGANDE